MPTYGGWGPPAIDPGTISGLLDPYIERQKQLRSGQALAQGLGALTKGDYGGMATAMQYLAADNPQLAGHLMSAYETEAARKRQEAQFQQTQEETKRQHDLELYRWQHTPQKQEEDILGLGGGVTYPPVPSNLYRTPGLGSAGAPGSPPAAASAPAPGSTAAEVIPPATTSSPTPAVRTPPPAIAAPAPAVAPAPTPAPTPAPVVPVPTSPPPSPPAPAVTVPAPAVAPAPAPAPEPPPPPPPNIEVPSTRAAIIAAINSGKKGQEFLAMLPPIVRNELEQLTRYEKGPENYTRKHQEAWTRLARMADDTYIPERYAEVKRTLLGYSPGATGMTPGAQIRNLNVGAGHFNLMEQLNSELAKVRPTDIPAINAIYQRIGKELGHPEVTNWNMMKSIVVPEIMKVINGANIGTGKERDELGHSLAASGSVQQALEGLAIVKDAMGQRYVENKRGFDTGTFGTRPFQFSSNMSGMSMKMMLQRGGVDVRDVTPRNLEMLFKNRGDKTKLADFDSAFGNGRAQEILDGLR